MLSVNDHAILGIPPIYRRFHDSLARLRQPVSTIDRDQPAQDHVPWQHAIRRPAFPAARNAGERSVSVGNSPRTSSPLDPARPGGAEACPLRRLALAKSKRSQSRWISTRMDLQTVPSVHSIRGAGHDRDCLSAIAFDLVIRRHQGRAACGSGSPIICFFTDSISG